MINFLVFIAIILFIIAAAQLMRVFELSSSLRGEKREVITESDNRMNARLMMGFLIFLFAFCLWQLFEYKDKLLPEAASVHGESLDTLFNVNLIIITFVFIITEFVLFYFAYKYYGRTGSKATFYPHNNKLELIWTTIPAIVLAFIIIYGLKTWNAIMTDPSKDALVIELYSKQFDWTARYAGADTTLGKTNYKLIDEANNPLGIDPSDPASKDDLIIKGEFHIPVGKEVAFTFRSRDVIHSAYMPHFRAQMNTVPGMITMFHFTPTITTEEMRRKTGNPNFDYVVLCNKICGASHYNMQMTIVVDKPEDYAKWIKEQDGKRFGVLTASAEGTAPSGNTPDGKVTDPAGDPDHVSKDEPGKEKADQSADEMRGGKGSGGTTN